MLIRARVHPFPFRTRKLSSLLPKILVWRRTGKIGSAYTKRSSACTAPLFSDVSGTGESGGSRWSEGCPPGQTPVIFSPLLVRSKRARRPYNEASQAGWGQRVNCSEGARRGTQRCRPGGGTGGKRLGVHIVARGWPRGGGVCAWRTG